MVLFPQTKSAKFFWAAGLLAVGLFLFAIGYEYYDQWQGEKKVEELAEALKQMEQEIYNRKAADKIGGKTPQETLDLFIKAVEAGDYELASKYFVIEKQEEWKDNLTKVSNVNEFLKIVKNTRHSQGEYSEDRRTYSIYKPTSIDFVLYPSGNWKIEEI
jgi:hypothetical protein